MKQKKKSLNATYLLGRGWRTSRVNGRKNKHWDLRNRERLPTVVANKRLRATTSLPPPRSFRRARQTRHDRGRTGLARRWLDNDNDNRRSTLTSRRRATGGRDRSAAPHGAAVVAATDVVMTTSTRKTIYFSIPLPRQRVSLRYAGYFLHPAPRRVLCHISDFIVRRSLRSSNYRIVYGRRTRV